MQKHNTDQPNERAKEAPAETHGKRLEGNMNILFYVHFVSLLPTCVVQRLGILFLQVTGHGGGAPTFQPLGGGGIYLPANGKGGGTYLPADRGIPTLPGDIYPDWDDNYLPADWRVPTFQPMEGGELGYLPCLGGTYLSWAVPTLMEVLPSGVGNAPPVQSRYPIQGMYPQPG